MPFGADERLLVRLERDRALAEFVQELQHERLEALRQLAAAGRAAVEQATQAGRVATERAVQAGREAAAMAASEAYQTGYWTRAAQHPGLETGLGGHSDHAQATA